MKPRSKSDSWCYTASTRPARKKVRRLTNKRRRGEDEKIIGREAASLPRQYHSISLFHRTIDSIAKKTENA
jgi:hypothetical protein